ncbi:hypothetical protein SAMN02746095_03594 [Acidocella aminolytica 101 = DSM 11237]|uniref:hypothetical protein n=2 Tax=Acidocella aminolytica TaxID=33998 RepID=UPI0009161917|nr:hypothetical protein [Acidocella aminolytica]SHF52918.1 hypothetical protein SAMN02746095_03594 [Acidocella aminolytica 101 = DSM 11237]
MTKPALALTSPHASSEMDHLYIWEQRTDHCFICVGEAEVSRPSDGRPWVAMVPLIMDGAAPTAWGLMLNPSGEGVREFSSAEDAKAAAEQYLTAYRQYYRSGAQTGSDPATGKSWIAGSQINGD